MDRDDPGAPQNFAAAAAGAPSGGTAFLFAQKSGEKRRGKGGLEEAAPLASPCECDAKNDEIFKRFRAAVRAPASLALPRWET